MELRESTINTNEINIPCDNSKINSDKADSPNKSELKIIDKYFQEEQQSKSP